MEIVPPEHVFLRHCRNRQCKYFFIIFGDDMISPHTYTRVRVHAQTGEDYTQGDRDVILMPTGFRRRCVGKTLIDVFHCDIDDIPLLASW